MFYLVIVLVGSIEIFFLGHNLGIRSVTKQTVEEGNLSKNTLSPPDKFEIYDLVNKYRISQELKPLSFNPVMCSFAQERLGEIHSDWSHNGYLEINRRYKYIHFGENLAKGMYFPKEFVASWINSPSHLENIVNPEFTDTCIETDVSWNSEEKTDYTWVVQHFASF